MEALMLIRRAVMARENITLENGHYICGGQRLDGGMKTAFQRSIKNGGHYTVRDIVFYLEYSEIGESEYRTKCMSEKCMSVITTDRVSLRQFLQGEINVCDQIDNDMKDYQLNGQSEASLKRKVPEGGDLCSLSTTDRPSLKELRRDDRPCATSLSVLFKQGADFSFALKLFNECVLRPPSSKSKSSSTNLPGAAGGKRQYATPIIIVPNALTSNITLGNVAHFLMSGEYVPLDPKKGHTQETEKMIFHGHNNVNCEFKVVDNVSKFKERPEYWDRVVAVFVSGQPWQFKNWKWSEPVDLFQNVLGVHLLFADSEVNTNVSGWNCKILKVKRI
jgi:hypothetical protein